jgi:hypothetical protein
VGGKINIWNFKLLKDVKENSISNFELLKFTEASPQKYLGQLSQETGVYM